VKKGIAPPPVIIEGVDCSFYDDLTTLKHFGAANTETVGELLYAFFRHFSVEFDYNHSVISIRHGKYLSKIEKGWHEDVERFYRYFCIEEPFNTSRNLGNTVDGITVEGIRQEFERATSILMHTANLYSICEKFYQPKHQYSRYYNSLEAVPVHGIYPPHTQQNNEEPTSHYPTAQNPNGNFPAQYYQIPLVHPYFLHSDQYVRRTQSSSMLLTRHPSPERLQNITQTKQPFSPNTSHGHYAASDTGYTTHPHSEKNESDDPAYTSIEPTGMEHVTYSDNGIPFSTFAYPNIPVMYVDNAGNEITYSPSSTASRTPEHESDEEIDLEGLNLGDTQEPSFYSESAKEKFWDRRRNSSGSIEEKPGSDADAEQVHVNYFARDRMERARSKSSC
jgi:hypothetical protein